MKLKRLKLILMTTAAIAVLLAVSIYLGYASNSSDAVTLMVKKAAVIKIVGNHVVTAYDLEKAYEIGEKLDSTTDKSQVLNQLIKNEQTKSIAENHKVRLGSDSVSDELAFLKNEQGNDYQNFLNQYFDGDEGLFVKFVAGPLAWDAALKNHFNSDLGLNNASMTKAQTALDRIKAGESFETVAKEVSNDQVSGQLGGDIGFVAHGQVLPELEAQYSISPVGRVIDHVLVSRQGYHLIYPVETANQNGKKLWHIKQILVKTSGYDDWFSQEAKSVKIITIKNS
ncbi:MAG: peptidylprolyl isomerase [Acidobacteriaceae bacterium]